MQISEVFLFSSLLSLYLFSWLGFLHHTMTFFWHWCGIQMQTSPDAVVKPLGSWVVVFGHCTISECALCDFILPAEPVPRLILKVCSVCFVLQWPDTAHLCVSLSFLQFCFLCCCTTKRAERLKQVKSSWNTHGMCLYWTGNRAYCQS